MYFCLIGTQNTMPSCQKHTPPVCVFNDFAGWAVSIRINFSIELNKPGNVRSRQTALDRLLLKHRFNVLTSYQHPNNVVDNVVCWLYINIVMLILTQLAYDVRKTLLQRRFNILTSLQRPYNVVSTSCAGWERPNHCIFFAADFWELQVQWTLDYLDFAND